jgi:hypothetical protein
VTCYDCDCAAWAMGEDYMVHDELWPLEHDGFLCIGCLEARIGRRLVPTDFTDAPANAETAGSSERLLDRQGR